MANSTGSKEAMQTGKRSPKLSTAQRREILKRLFAISEAIGERFSAERADIYLQRLEDLPFERLIEELTGMLDTCRWFPKIPEIREAVLGNPLSEDAEREWAVIAQSIDHWQDQMEFESDCYASGFSCGAQALSTKGLSEPARMVLTRLGGPRAVAATNPAFIMKLKDRFVEEYKHVVKEHPHLREIEGTGFAGLLKSMDGDEPKQ